MKVCMLLDRIIEATSDPVNQEFPREATAAEIAAAREETATAFAECNELIESLRAAHPDVLLAKLLRWQEALALRQSSIQRAENTLVAAAGVDPDDEAIKQRLIELQHREQMLMRQTFASGAGGPSSIKVLSMKFVRADATEHFRHKVDEAAAEKEKLQKRFDAAPPNTTMGPRLAERMRDLDATINQWTRTKQLCELGEKVHAIRAEIQQLRGEQEQRQQERRREVLAV